MIRRGSAGAAVAERPEARAEVSRVIDLRPGDWLRATWRKREPLPRPTPAPFDLKGCVERLSRVVTVAGAIDREWAWGRAGISDALTPAEARFWFEAMTGMSEKVRPKELALYLARQDLRPLSGVEIRARLRSKAQFLSPEILVPLANLLPLDEVVDVLRNADPVPSGPGDYMAPLVAARARGRLAEGFARHVFPYLTDVETERLRAALRPEVQPDRWPRPAYGVIAPTEFLLAAALGMHAEMLALVSGWSPDSDREYTHPYLHAQEIVFGLGSAELVESYLRRLRLTLRTAGHVRAWLAHTELTALDYVRDSILSASKTQADELMEAFCLARAPEAAPYVLELKLQGRSPARARRWLDEEVGNAVAGLAPLAGGRDKLANAALEFLREAKRRGLAPLLEEQLREAPELGRVKREVLTADEAPCPPFDDATTPAWLAEAEEDARLLNPGRAPEWVRPTNLPPVVVEGRCLNERQVHALLAALRASTPEKPALLVKALREHAEPARLGAFGWRLFELWLGEGAPARNKWALLALGLMGGDAAALKLAPLVRTWPGQGQHKRAVWGLEVLRAIGTDTALMQLNDLAQRVRYKALTVRAREHMEAIAAARGLTRQQLEDRIVPDAGLDETGGRTFDFGPRQFRLAFGPGLKPLVRDAAGKVKANLPKPGAKDDPEKARAALEAWAVLKKQVREALKVQSQRLERLMVVGRRWAVAEFESLLVRHPLLVHLVRRLLWGGHDAGGRLVRTFRVTEERQYADMRDAPCTLEGVASVGIVHPLHLTPEELTGWGEVFGDYEIIPPFPQLGRKVHRLLPGEERRTALTRFNDTAVPLMLFMGVLKSNGWTNGIYDEGHYLPGYRKRFEERGVVAVISSSAGAVNVQLTGASFEADVPGAGPNERPPLPLGQVDPVVVSEVLGVLGVLASKAS
ncbi:MAG TPA: DUF4132 domain-containing protein [Gemmataceae bacterium]|nr:DUF4132 domain-containing protein [Gemmataceae bacterium]